MIFVTAVVNEGKVLRQLKVRGHSGFSQKGSDIVCSAVSILTQSLYLSLKNMTGLRLNYIDNNDDLLLEIVDFDKILEGELRGITLYFILGIKSLLKEYNKYISFSIKEK